MESIDFLSSNSEEIKELLAAIDEVADIWM